MARNSFIVSQRHRPENDREAWSGPGNEHTSSFGSVFSDFANQLGKSIPVCLAASNIELLHVIRRLRLGHMFGLKATARISQSRIRLRIAAKNGI